MANFLIDASLPRPTAALVASYGHGATDVRDIGMGAAPDEQIAAYAQLNHLSHLTDREKLLSAGAVAITRPITDDIRDVIQRNRKIRTLVFNEGAVPLARLARALDVAAQGSLAGLRKKN